MGLVLKNSEALVPPLFHVPWDFLIPIRKKMMPKFREFSKRAEDGPSRAGSHSKTFPEVPTIFRVSSGNPESRLRISLGLGFIEGSLGTWNTPELLAVSGSQNSLHQTRNSQKLARGGRIPLLLHRQFINSCLSGSICFLRNKFFSILHFLAISGAIFPEECISHFQFSA